MANWTFPRFNHNHILLHELDTLYILIYKDSSVTIRTTMANQLITYGQRLQTTKKDHAVVNTSKYQLSKKTTITVIKKDDKEDETAIVAIQHQTESTIDSSDVKQTGYFRPWVQK